MNRGKKKSQHIRGEVQRGAYFWKLISWAFPSQFSPHFGERTFWWAQGENTWALPFIFLHLHLTKHTQKKFFFPFSLQGFPSTLFHL